MLVFQLLFKQC